MKIYRNSVRKPDHEHVGYSFHSSQALANDARREEKAQGNLAETEQITVEITKAGVIAALNRFAGHADNG